MLTSLRTSLAAITFSIIGAACALTSQPASTPLSPEATESPTLQPTSTPVFTRQPATETPTLDPSPTATATNTPLPPTPDPNLNVGEEIYNESFDGTSGWYWTFSDDVASFEAKDGELKAETRQGNSWRFVVRSDWTAGDQLLRVTAKTVACPGNDEYGILYRANFDLEDKIHTYVLKLNCAGQARVERLDDQSTTVVRDWETFAAIQSEAPAENVFMIWMVKDLFHFYANDQYLFSLNDTALIEGFYGFYVNSHSNGGGALSFDDLVVKQIEAP